MVKLLKTLSFLRVPSNKKLVDGTVPSNKELLDGTVLSNKELVDGTVPSNSTIHLFKYSNYNFDVLIAMVQASNSSNWII